MIVDINLSDDKYLINRIDPYIKIIEWWCIPHWWKNYDDGFKYWIKVEEIVDMIMEILWLLYWFTYGIILMILMINLSKKLYKECELIFEESWLKMTYQFTKEIE